MKPFTENQTSDRLWYFATNRTKADAVPVASACLHITGDADNNLVLARLPEIQSRFAVLFKKDFPTGLHISTPSPISKRLEKVAPQFLGLNLPPGVPRPAAPVPVPQQPSDIRRYQAGLADALKLWSKAKQQVLGIPPDSAPEPISSPQAPTLTNRRLLIGGSAADVTLSDPNEPDPVTDSSCAAASLLDDGTMFPQVAPRPTAPAVANRQPAPSASAQPRDVQREVTVRPAKPASTGAPISNATAPQQRWTPEELQAALQDAAQIAHLVQAGGGVVNELNPQDRLVLTDTWTRGITPPEIAPGLLVGRGRELKVIHDGINRLQNGGSIFQLLTGPNGVGKSLLLEAIEQMARHNGLAVARVELTAQDRFMDTSGATRQLLSQLLSNLKFGGEAEPPGLNQLLDQLCAKALDGAKPSVKQLTKVIEGHCQKLLFQPGGEDVVKVLIYYAQNAGDLGRQVKSLKWLRAEYDSVSEARKDLGVSSIVGDADFLKHLTTLATLCHLAGFRGLIVILDELTIMVRNLHKSVRQANYDTILNVYNASASGQSPGLGFLFAGTMDYLDPRQGGLLSHPALASRLKTPPGTHHSTASPILELKPLRPVELFLALQKARCLVLGADGEMRLPDLALEHLLDACLRPLGAEEFLPPRDVLKRFASVVQHLEADPGITWQAALGITESTTNSPKGDVRPASHSSFQNLKL